MVQLVEKGMSDPQGNKFQVWQRSDMVTQPLRDDVPAFIGGQPCSSRRVILRLYVSGIRSF